MLPLDLWPPKFYKQLNLEELNQMAQSGAGDAIM